MTKTCKDFKATLSHIFESVARRALTVAGALTLSFSAMAQEGAKPQETAPPVTWTVDDLKKEVSRTDIGRAMVDHADKGGVAIVFSEQVAEPEQEDVAVASYSGDTVRIDPRLSRTEQVVTLAHELRHMMQDGRLSYYALESGTLMLPEERWIQRRYVEADAIAFSAYFWADRMLNLSSDGVRMSMLNEFKMAHDMLQEMKGDGLSLDEYRALAFEPALSSLGLYLSAHLEVADGALRYLDGTLFVADMMIQKGMYDDAEKLLREIESRRNSAPDSAAFEKLIRGYGGLSVDMTGPTCLDSVSRTDLLENYPRRASAMDEAFRYPEILAGRLEERNQIFEKMMDVYEHLRDRIVTEKMAEAGAAGPVRMPVIPARNSQIVSAPAGPRP